MRKSLGIWVLPVLLLWLASFSGLRADGVEAVVNANNRFAFELYSQLIKTEKGNVFFSPLSLETALGMAYEGARGKTARQMERVCRFPANDRQRRQAFQTLLRDFNRPDPAYKLSIANALWGQKGYPFRPAYLGVLRDFYLAQAASLDFTGQPKQAAKAVNDWVKQQTQGRIPNLISSKDIDNYTRLLLTNAVYFKGEWAEKFEAVPTTGKANFTLASQKKVKVDMMQGRGENYYFQNDNWQIVELPYKGKRFSMVILLPRKNNLGALERRFGREQLNFFHKNMRRFKVRLTMPEFGFNCGYSLLEPLTAMGMTVPFNEDADFSGMTNDPLDIGKILHKAAINVNEKGSEATAATCVEMEYCSMVSSSATFAADHPFLFLIRDHETGAILFLGRVMDPRAH